MARDKNNTILPMTAIAAYRPASRSEKKCLTSTTSRLVGAARTTLATRMAIRDWAECVEMERAFLLGVIVRAVAIMATRPEAPKPRATAARAPLDPQPPATKPTPAA